MQYTVICLNRPWVSSIWKQRHCHLCTLLFNAGFPSMALDSGERYVTQPAAWHSTAADISLRVPVV